MLQSLMSGESRYTTSVGTACFEAPRSPLRQSHWALSSWWQLDAYLQSMRQSTMLSPRFTALVLAIFAVGLIATLARGPWVGTLVLVLVYLGTGRNAVANLGLFVFIGAVALVFLLLTPVGDRLLDLLPFIGSVDAASVTYRGPVRERNASHRTEPVVWVRRLPVDTGNEGEHIIDIVNTYVGITLSISSSD